MVCDLAVFFQGFTLPSLKSKKSRTSPGSAAVRGSSRAARRPSICPKRQGAPLRRAAAPPSPPLPPTRAPAAASGTYWSVCLHALGTRSAQNLNMARRMWSWKHFSGIWRRRGGGRGLIDCSSSVEYCFLSLFFIFLLILVKQLALHFMYERCCIKRL